MLSDRDTARSRPDELIVIAVRIGVVASLAALAVQTDPVQRAPLVAVMSVVAVAAVYALLLAAARLARGSGPRPIVVSGIDAVLALLATALTGGAVSLAVATTAGAWVFPPSSGGYVCVTLAAFHQPTRACVCPDRNAIQRGCMRMPTACAPRGGRSCDNFYLDMNGIIKISRIFPINRNKLSIAPVLAI